MFPAIATLFKTHLWDKSRVRRALTSRPSDSTGNLLTLLRERGVESGAAILDAGTGLYRRRCVTAELVNLCDSTIDYLEPNEARATEANRQLGERLRIFNDQIDRFYVGAHYALVYIDILPRRMPDLFQSILPAAAALAQPGGLIAINVPVRQTAATRYESDASGFRQFLDAHDGGREIRSSVFAKACCGSSAPASYFGARSSLHQPMQEFQYRTLLFMQRRSRSAMAAPAGEQPRYFTLDDTADLFDRFRRDVQFVKADDFLSLRRQKIDKVDGKAVHFVKHDIHRDLLNAYRLAEMEAEKGVFGSYFVMHPHELSSNYVARQETLDVLKQIQAMGHDIGVHVDALALAASEDGLVKSLEAFLGLLRSAGINVRHGNAHGNTRLRQELGLWGNLVFAESMTPELEERLPERAKAYAGCVSLKMLSRELGIRGWIDTTLFEDGDRLPTSTYMISDNRRRLMLLDLGNKTLFEGDLWENKSAMHERLLEVVRESSCLYLLHPQYYR